MMAKSMTAINPDGHSNDVHNDDGHMEVYVGHKVWFFVSNTLHLVDLARTILKNNSSQPLLLRPAYVLYKSMFYLV